MDRDAQVRSLQTQASQLKAMLQRVEEQIQAVQEDDEA
jgi:hypothetical protein